MSHAAFTAAAPARPAVLLPAPSANRPLRAAPTPDPIAPFKPSRIDPVNREPGAFPDPAPQQHIPP